MKILSAEKDSTMNIALLIRSEVEDCLDDKDGDSLAITQMKLSMSQKLSHRFPVDDMLIISAILDPRFMNLRSIKCVLDDRSIGKAEFLAKFVKENIKKADVRSSNVKPTSSAQDYGASSSKDIAAGSSLLTLAMKHSNIEDETYSAIDQECLAYLSSSHPSHVTDNNIIKFWKGRMQQFPWLTTLARKLLCIPATSTPSERVFNVAGLTISARRSSIHPNNVDKVIFIHDNYEYCKNHISK